MIGSSRLNRNKIRSSGQDRRNSYKGKSLLKLILEGSRTSKQGIQREVHKSQ